MWVDLLTPEVTERSIDDVLADVMKLREAALKAEVWSWVLQDFDFRHAVVLHSTETTPIRYSKLAEEYAGSLLAEWGRARGGEPCGGVEVEKWDFRRSCGYAMMFKGALTEPATTTRLTGKASVMHEILRDREEVYVVPAVDLELIKASTA